MSLAEHRDESPDRIAFAVLTFSDSRDSGSDRGGDFLVEVIEGAGHRVAHRALHPDEGPRIAAAVRAAAARDDVDLVLTTGGTGLSPRDVTPEATLSVIEYQVPGIPEAVRAGTAEKTPMAMLSRAVAGMRAGCLVINLPGSPNGVRQALQVIGPVIGHAIDIARGRGSHGSEHDGHSDRSGRTTH